MTVGGRGGWRWAAVAVLLALLVLGLGFILRSAGLGAAANAAQLVALAPLIGGLIAWARSRRGLHQHALEESITFGEFLRTIADAQGLTGRDLHARMPALDAEVIDAYMDGNQFPTWGFVTNLLDVVAGDDPWRRETLERRVRPVWQATARRQSLGPSVATVTVSDSTELSASGKWFTAVRQVSQARQVLSLVQRSVDRHRALEAGLTEMLRRLSEAVISLTNERDRLRAELDALKIDNEDGGTTQRAYVESDDLRRQLRDTQERLLVAERIREATSQRLEESERQRLLAERLRDEALEQAERARRRLAELEGRPTALPRATVGRDSAGDSQPVMMGDDDQRIAEEVLRQVDEVLRDEAEALDQLEDKLAAGPRPQLVLSYQEPAPVNRNVLEPTPREDHSERTDTVHGDTAQQHNTGATIGRSVEVKPGRRPTTRQRQYDVSDISSAEELIRYATRAQLALVSDRASQNTIALAIGMGGDRRSAGANFVHTLASGRLSDAKLHRIDEVIGTLAPTGSIRVGGLSPFAISLRGLRDRESLSDRVSPSLASEVLQRPADSEADIITQASALLSAFLAAEQIDKANHSSRSVQDVHARYSNEIVRVAEQLIVIGFSPPTTRSVEALIILGALGGYAFDIIKHPLDYALKHPLGFRVWGIVTALVLLSRRTSNSAYLRVWVEQLLADAEELREESVYPGQSFDLELAISVPSAWSPPDNDWAGKALLARAYNSKATVRERGTAAMGLWQRAVADNRYRDPVVANLGLLIEQFEAPAERPDAYRGMQWTAATLRYVMARNTGACNDWPEVNEQWIRHVDDAVNYLGQQGIPEQLLPGTSTLFRHSLLQNAGVHRRHAIEAMIAGGWTGPVARAFERFLELESAESWIRIRALFALGFLQYRDRGVESSLAGSCQRAYSNLIGTPSQAQIIEMHTALFAIGDCFGATGIAEEDVRRVRAIIQDVLVGIVNGSLTAHPALFPVSRATAYLLTFMILPRENNREDLAEKLLIELSKHSDTTTRELSMWALRNRVNDNGDVRSLVHARL